MKLSLFLCVLLGVLGASAASTLSINQTGSNTFRLTISNSPAGRPCWLSSSTNVFALQPLLYFVGSNQPFSTNIISNDALGFYGAASDAIIVTQFWTTSFVPYPSPANTNRPCQWMAFPAVTYNQVINGFGQILTINNTNWFLFVHQNELLEIRTVDSYTNPPVFPLGSEMIID